MEKNERKSSLVPIAVLGVIFTLLSSFLLLGEVADADVEVTQDTIRQVQ